MKKCHHKNVSEKIGRMKSHTDLYDLELYNCLDCKSTISKRIKRPSVTADEDLKIYNLGKIMGICFGMVSRQALAKDIKIARRLAAKVGKQRLFNRSYRMFKNFSAPL